MPPLRRLIPLLSKRVKTHHTRSFATAYETLSGYKATADRVRIVEVGPRDGLQNEKKAIPLGIKIDLIERLARTGLRDIEAGSFVAPKWVPQMENSGEILNYILNDSLYSPFPITYSFLAPNMKGLDNAMAIIQQNASSVDATTSGTIPSPPDGGGSATAANKPEIEFAVFPAATETFTQKNLNCDIATSLQRFKPVIEEAKLKGYRVRAYISVVLGCPFEGYDVDPRKVAEMATDLLEMGADEIDLGDTTGMGTAIRTANLLRAMSAAGVRNEDIAMHFHDTYGQALVNTTVSLEYGIRTFDSSVGGLGGCPYSPGATGNVATEDMVYFMEELGMKTGVNLDAMVDIGAWITAEIGKPNASSVGKAILGRRSRS